MKYILLSSILVFFLSACSKSLHVEDDDYEAALNNFIGSCQTQKTKDIYDSLCEEAKITTNAKKFLKQNFQTQKLTSDTKGLLTGYYEASLRGSITKKEPYIYPIYEVPKDLVVVELSEQYPQLKGMKLRGRVVDGKLIPYYERAELDKNILDANVICYVDSKVDLFFLQVQGSGRVQLDNGETLHVGYANQNGHPYTSIGKYLVNISEISKENISLQSIKKYFDNNPDKIDEVLNQNKSVIFFQKKDHAASGSLGLELTPKRSIAVDTRYVQLGSMLYLKAKTGHKTIQKIVMAQDTGGAIKGEVRADMFLGYGDEAMNEAGELKADLELWLMLPKDNK